MRGLGWLLLFISSCAFSKQLILAITPEYALTPVNTQLICSSLHANLSSDAVLMLDTLEHAAYLCQMIEDTDGKHLVITLTLKDS